MKLPFFYQLNFKPQEDGWDLYSLEKEFERTFNEKDGPCDWRISGVNKDYRVR
jgi:hypothetical protein